MRIYQKDLPQDNSPLIYRAQRRDFSALTIFLHSLRDKVIEPPLAVPEEVLKSLLSARCYPWEVLETQEAMDALGEKLIGAIALWTREQRVEVLTVLNRLSVIKTFCQKALPLTIQTKRAHLITLEELAWALSQDGVSASRFDVTGLYTILYLSGVFYATDADGVPLVGVWYVRDIIRVLNSVFWYETIVHYPLTEVEKNCLGYAFAQPMGWISAPIPWESLTPHPDPELDVIGNLFCKQRGIEQCPNRALPGKSKCLDHYRPAPTPQSRKR